MKKIKYISILIVIALSFLLVSCTFSNNSNTENNSSNNQTEENETLSYSYARYVSSKLEDSQTAGRYYNFGGKYSISTQIYEGGGYVEGNTEQTVVSGMFGSEVTAVADEGFEFITWSDGLTTPTRKDTTTYCFDVVDSSVSEGFKQHGVYPLFAKLHTVNFTAMRGGHIIGELTQTIATGKSGTTLTAVAEDGYIFMGWYLEDPVYGGASPGSLTRRISKSETLNYDPYKYGLPESNRYNNIIATFIERL